MGYDFNRKREETLLQKVMDRTINQSECLELEKILMSKHEIQELDINIRFLIRLGLACLGGYGVEMLRDEVKK